SIEAADLTGALINKMAKSGKLCRHLHISIQSGDDEILKKMRRRYSRGDYLKLVKKIKNKIPDIAITTDCLIGFPGEAQKHFRNTLGLVKRIIPLRTHIFPYSARKGTRSYLKPDINLLSRLTVKKNINILRLAANSCSKIYKERFLGRKLPVLFEAKSKERKGYWEGYTDNYIRVRVKSDENLKNQLIQAK
ncbi:MAG: radical SAM protein, partial [Candidatus Omnitrophota bacterium]